MWEAGPVGLGLFTFALSGPDCLFLPANKRIEPTSPVLGHHGSARARLMRKHVMPDPPPPLTP